MAVNLQAFKMFSQINIYAVFSAVVPLGIFATPSCPEGSVPADDGYCYQVSKIVSLVDRKQGGAELYQSQGLKFETLFDIVDIQRHAS